MGQEREFLDAVAALMEQFSEVSADYVLAKFEDDDASEGAESRLAASPSGACPPGKSRRCVTDPVTGRQLCYCA